MDDHILFNRVAALFESVEVLEDPFVGYTELDGIGKSQPVGVSSMPISVGLILSECYSL